MRKELGLSLFLRDTKRPSQLLFACPGATPPVSSSHTNPRLGMRKNGMFKPRMPGS